MPEGMIDLVELSHSWLNAEPVDCLYGACHLTAKHHGPELFNLTDAELFGVMKELALCAHAIKTVTGAVKINYEIHGNTSPHLHIHIYPRYMNDPFPNQAINPNIKKQLYSKEEYEAFQENVRREIERLQRERTTGKDAGMG